MSVVFELSMFLLPSRYMRLQALIRSRVLSHKFKHLRGHIVRLQARCRGHVARKVYAKRVWAVVTIQAHVRRFIQQKRYRKLKVKSAYISRAALELEQY